MRIFRAFTAFRLTKRSIRQEKLHEKDKTLSLKSIDKNQFYDIIRMKRFEVYYGKFGYLQFH